MSKQSKRKALNVINEEPMSINHESAAASAIVMESEQNGETSGRRQRRAAAVSASEAIRDENSRDDEEQESKLGAMTAASASLAMFEKRQRISSNFELSQLVDTSMNNRSMSATQSSSEDASRSTQVRVS